MELKYSTPKGVPYIEFDDVNKFIFPTLIEHPVKGFNAICFSGMVGTTISLSKKSVKKANRKTMTITDRINFTTDIDLSAIPKDANSILTPITISFLKSCFDNVRDGEYISRKALIELGKMLEKTNGYDEDEWEEDPDIEWDGTWDDED